jgi:2-polyprenyl-6-methoxyphenol hydroxylase-like FAD-dependent oxidoreductase
MSGLFSAAFLRQVGWDVDVYERSGVELVGRGAGITVHPELIHALEASGAGTKELGIEVPKHFAIDRQDRITDERPLRRTLTSWDRLQRLLRATVDPAHYHLGWAFERVAQNGSGVRVHFNGGRIEEADILVGDDGIRSGVRGQIAPELQPIYAGYYIWRGAPNEADLSPKTLHEIYPYFVFYLPPRQEVITYPIAGFNDDLTPGKRRFNFIWYNVDQRRNAARDERRQARRAARILGAAAAHPQGIDRADARQSARNLSGGAGRRGDGDEATFHHADLPLHRAADRFRPSGDGGRCRRQCAPAYGLRRGQGGR